MDTPILISIAGLLSVVMVTIGILIGATIPRRDEPEVEADHSDCRRRQRAAESAGLAKGEQVGHEKGFVAGRDEGGREARRVVAEGLRDLADTLDNNGTEDDVFVAEEDEQDVA